MRVFLAAVCAALPLVAAAQSSTFESDFDDGSKQWKEIEVQLPPFPKAENAMQFEVGMPRENRFYLDTASISIGADGVVRYAVMAVSDAGARNIAFEGIRCEMRQFRVYAFGRPDRTWSRARNSEWRRIEYSSLNNYRGVLWQELLCDNKNPVPDLGQVKQRLYTEQRSIVNRGPYSD